MTADQSGRGPKMGLLARMFTASQGKPDTERPPGDGSPAWMSPISTMAEFEARLDLAAEIGAKGIEVTQASQPSGTRYLLGSAKARAEFLRAYESRGLEIAALNCSGMSMHPVTGAAHQQLIRDTIELAGLLGVTNIVTMTGTTGDGPGSSTVNWVFYPLTGDSLALLERQWSEGIALWSDIAEHARSCGVERIAFELHPLHLVYNVPTLMRMREAIGPIIGANLDPSHMFWQRMDPVAVVRAVSDAVFHVQLKDSELLEDQLATVGVLDQRPFTDPHNRAWRDRTIGRGHGAEFWQAFIDALAEVGYDHYVCIENEDPFQPYEEGVREAGRFLAPLLAGGS